MGFCEVLGIAVERLEQRPIDHEATGAAHDNKAGHDHGDAF